MRWLCIFQNVFSLCSCKQHACDLWMHGAAKGCANTCSCPKYISQGQPSLAVACWLHGFFLKKNMWKENGLCPLLPLRLSMSWVTEEVTATCTPLQTQNNSLSSLPSNIKTLRISHKSQQTQLHHWSWPGRLLSRLHPSWVLKSFSLSRSFPSFLPWTD